MDTDESMAIKSAKAVASRDCNRRGGVSIGFTAVDVSRSYWGAPRKVNKTVTARGRHEQWVYNGG